MFDRFKRPIEEYDKIWLGSISLLVTAVVLAVILGIGRLSPGHQNYSAEFLQAAQIRSGDQVTVAGIPVGTVEGVALAGDRVTVRFTVQNDVALGSDTRAAIKLTTLLGSRYLELSPAGTGEITDRTVRLANTSVPYDLQKTLADATTTFEQIDAGKVAESMATMSQALDQVPDALPQALNNVKALATIISNRRDQIGSLLESVDTVTAMIRDQQANLGSLVLQGRDLLGDIVSRRAAVDRLFAGVTALVNTLRNVLGNEPAINTMLASMADFSRMIAEKDALLRSTLQVLPLPFRNLANASGSATSIDVNVLNGILIDSWMCAISGRAKQFNLTQYFTDCEPTPDLWPGWPAPEPERVPR